MTPQKYNIIITKKYLSIKTHTYEYIQFTKISQAIIQPPLTQS